MHKESITKQDLITAIGPAPTLKATAEFLREDPQNIYKKLYRGELKRLPGHGITKISIASLLEYLNGGRLHVKGLIRNKAGRGGSAKGKKVTA